VVALTPAALGQRIARLEDHVGRRLFARTSRRISLTEEGRALLPLAEGAVQTLASCVLADGACIARPRLDLVLGTRHELGMSWIVPMLPLLVRACPFVTFHLYFGSGSDLLCRIRSGEIHCAIGSMRVQDRQISSFRVHREDYVFVGSSALLDRPLERFSETSRYALIDENAQLPLFGYWRDSPAGTELDFRQIVYRGTIAAIHQAVLQRGGLAVLPRYLIRADLETGELRPIFPRVEPLHDYFKLFFRTGDPNRDFYRALAGEMSRQPLA
jgi:LysR family glycine cleavage system transcriptional activator